MGKPGKGGKGGKGQKPSDDPNFFKVATGEFLGTYNIEGLLGSGTFSKVFKSTSDGRAVAIKVLDPEASYIQYTSIAKREAEMLRDHSEKDAIFIKFYEALDVTHAGRPFTAIVTEALHESLYDVVQASGPIPPVQCVHCAIALMRALELLRQWGIIHTDIKHKNAMLNDRDFTKVKLIDFGNALRVDEPKHYPIHTKQFRAPEVMLRYGEYGYPSDVWCVGHVLYYITHGRLLFNTHDTKDHLRRMVAHLGPFPADMKNAPQGARTEPSLGPLLDGVLALDPAARMLPSKALEVIDAEGEGALH